MKRTMVALCVLFVLAWATADTLAQGKGKNRPGRPTDRAANPNKPAENVKPDANTPAGQAKGTPATPNLNKGGKGQGKDALERTQGQAQGKGKAAKDPLAGGKGPADKGQGGKGKEHQQQLQAFQKQLQHETAKHMERQARLTRIRELAVQKGDKEMIDRVDKLIAKENQVSSRKLEQLQQQHRALLSGGAAPGTGAAVPPVGKKDKDTVDVNKPAEKPADAVKPAESKPLDTTGANAPKSDPALQGGQPQEKPPEQPKPAAEKTNEAKPR